MTSNTRQQFVRPSSDYAGTSSMDPFDIVTTLDAAGSTVDEICGNADQHPAFKSLSGEEQRFLVLANSPKIRGLAGRSEEAALKWIALLMTSSVPKVQAIRDRVSEKLRHQEFRA